MGAGGMCVWEYALPGGSCLCRGAGRLLSETSLCLYTCGSHVCLLKRDLKNLNMRDRDLADVEKLTAQEGRM